ncbi:hypothetical protein M406DRAFT_348971 [Cryphonectria parasitica EP155]|uniref:ubiquitinyl hydrolase 1 n=1 Tax=Cryphonectria parasitica (strain ATCC 38755 / EP155) TaxID=660469 RepID=A0A9P4YBF1_CRYP1|nr:uncharacterized protein M406DRAFT_348971 [Cryphonectria parasitica EP155]KAF3769958.1 hypothetical protein M406DRAFT_348971 [Cryphonectria parasitica EP155]
MSRPEELPRSASPLKRRAGSAAPDDNQDATKDVDMLSLPAAAGGNQDAPIVDGPPVEGVEEAVQEGNIDSPQDDASITAQADGNEEDIPDLVGLDMDRASVEDTQPGSDIGESILLRDGSGGDYLSEKDPVGAAEVQKGQSSGDSRAQIENGSRAANTDETADLDSKMLDAAATNATANGPTKLSSILGTAVDSAIDGKGKGNRSGRNGPAPSSIGTRGRQARSGRTLGLTGLGNLGNTCYMNSALQCIRSVEELTKYFLTEEYAEELNYDNPLGHGGNVARAYAYLLGMIYKKDSPPSSVTPRNFKDTVGRYAPQFSGWSQQDTQEFLGFLLDGLQEDLSRVKKKPYIEKPDSTDDMVGNQEKIRELAERVWAIHKARDDSVIGDLFTGLYKSTLVCPTCAKISITFEPFTNLTLPLPLQSFWTRKVKYFPLNDRPVHVLVELDKTANIRALKEFLSLRVGVPVERLIGGEEYKDKFFKIYDDGQQVSDEIQKDDAPAFYELESPPTNIPKKKKSHKYSSLLNTHDDLPPADDPLAEQMAQNMVVTVLHRLNPRSNRSNSVLSGRFQEHVSPPHFITLNPEEARDEDRIRRKILEKVATFTTRSPLSYLNGGEPADASDPEPSLINSSDAGSDGKVVAKSVEGEDDIVDVSMQDVAQTPSAQHDADRSSSTLKKFNTQRPEWVDPKVYLDGQLQSLFDLSFFSESSAIPSGWSSFGSSSDKLFPRLESRKPRPPTPSDEDMPSPSGSGTASEESSTDETPDIAPAPEVSTRMLEESSDDETFPEVTELPVRNPRLGLKGGKKKGYKTYSKKNNNKRFNKQQHQQNARRGYRQQNHSTGLFDDEDPEWGSKADGGPLVRLGEGIVVDWNPDLWDQVFGPDPNSDDIRPEKAATFLPGSIETLKDEQLEAKVYARRARSNKGISLDDCLAEFEKEEILSEDDKWYCPKCKEFCRAAKKFDLWHTPDILIVHLKRFSSANHRRDKIDVTVDFPIEGLDISSRVLKKDDGKEEVYDLIAIDDHMGGLGGGHYTAFAKNFENGAWYKYDDSTVSQVRDTSRMITSHAYLLFYRRRSDGPLGGPKLEEACRQYARLFHDEADSDDDEAVSNAEEGT